MNEVSGAPVAPRRRVVSGMNGFFALSRLNTSAIASMRDEPACSPKLLLIRRFNWEYRCAPAAVDRLTRADVFERGGSVGVETGIPVRRRGRVVVVAVGVQVESLEGVRGECRLIEEDRRHVDAEWCFDDSRDRDTMPRAAPRQRRILDRSKRIQDILHEVRVGLVGGTADDAPRIGERVRGADVEAMRHATVQSDDERLGTGSCPC